MRRNPPPLPKRSQAGKANTNVVGALPSESELLAFVANAPGRLGKREIARTFGIKGQAKLALKKLLKEVEHKGLLNRSGRKVEAAGVLPNIVMVEVTRIDDDGEVLARPVDWDEGRFGDAPVLQVTSGKGRSPGIGDRVLVRARVTDGTYSGEVLRIDRPPPTRVVGVFRSNPSGGRVISTARKDQVEYLVKQADAFDAEDGELVAAEILRPASRGLALARIRQRLGRSNDPRNISLIAVQTHGIPSEFPESVLDATQKLKPFEKSAREDLRHFPFVTIDPVDARDHDDAIWAEADKDEKNPGGYHLKIAIADVAAYVKPQSLLDKEARKRGNSVYFPDRVVPMLPERLSNDLCSLREGEDRPALVCHLTIDATGTTRSCTFVRAIIKIAAGLAYEDAQAAIDGAGSAKARGLLQKALRPLWGGYAVLLKARDRRGPLELDLPERKILLDSDGRFAGVTLPARLDAHRLVEEFMIRANVAAAQALNKVKAPLLFRIHDEPSAEKLRNLSEFLRTVGIPFALGQVIRAKTFNRILSAAKGKPHERLVHEVVLRSQAQALYRPKNSGHFGLGLADYAHFTSPIRRYADLVVHRALISAFELGDGGLSDTDIAQLEDTAELISAAERRAMLAERETVDRLVASFLADKIDAQFQGRISGVVSAGLFVVLSDTGADGFLPVSSLGHERFELHQAKHALIGAHGATKYQLGDPISVKLVEAVPLKGGLRFALAQGPELPPGRPKKKSTSRRH